MDDECMKCKGARRSSDKKPFCPPSGTVNDLLYHCSCGKYWVQSNLHFHLWQEETKESYDAWRRDILFALKYGDI